MRDFGFLRRHPGFVGYGFALKFGSSFGQTFFISLSVAAIGLDLGLSDADTGFIYSFATLSSAALLPLAGQWIDRLELRLYSLLVCAGMVAGCLTLATVDSVPMLFVGFLLVRLFGQGLLGHTAATTMARYFGENRGKALSIAALGYPLGEAVLPRLTVGIQALIGWRETWYATGAFLAVILIPASVILLRRRPEVESEDHEEPSESAEPQSRWTRGRLFRDPKFLLVLPVVLTPPFIGTGVFWHQIRLCEAKGWSVTLFATAFAAYAVSSILVSIFAGVAVDRLTARRCLVGYLIPQIV
ncbi:MAG: MFS transporter, partial [Planctomycetota bacterium]